MVGNQTPQAYALAPDHSDYTNMSACTVYFRVICRLRIYNFYIYDLPLILATSNPRQHPGVYRLESFRDEPNAFDLFPKCPDKSWTSRLHFRSPASFRWHSMNQCLVTHFCTFSTVRQSSRRGEEFSLVCVRRSIPNSLPFLLWGNMEF